MDRIEGPNMMTLRCYIIRKSPGNKTHFSKVGLPAISVLVLYRLVNNLINIRFLKVYL